MNGRRGPRTAGAVMVVFALLVGAVLLLVKLAGLEGGSSPKPPLSSVTLSPSERAKYRIHGPTHVDGTSLVDATGKTVRLQAIVLMNYGPAIQRPIQPLTIRDYDNIAGFGFNAVRLNFSWAKLEPNPPTDGRHQWDPQYLELLDTAVGEFTKRGVAVIMDLYQFGWFPQIPQWLYPEPVPFDAAQCGFVSGASGGGPVTPQVGAAAVWTFIMSRYAENPMVIGADLLTEPACPTGASLDPLYARLTGAIRSGNGRATIFFEDYVGNVVQRGGFGAHTAPDQNSVYAFHLYRPDWSEAVPLLDRYTSQGRELGTPTWLGEFDAFHANRADMPPQPNWQADMTRLFDYLRSHGVSGWAYWAYMGTGSIFEPDLATVDTVVVGELQKGFAT